MTTETELVKIQIEATGRAKILLEQNDYLIVKWTIPLDDGGVKTYFSFEAYAYGATGMANNYPWSSRITEEQAMYFIKHVDEAAEYFKSKHHYFHTEIREVSFDAISTIDKEVVRFKNGHWVTWRECVFNFNRLHPGSMYKCVGDRDITAEPPYIELYSTYAHDRILFDRKGITSEKRNFDNFHMLVRQIREFGYNVFDLS